MEKLTLPEPAASLWKRTRHTVHGLGERRPEQRIEPHLGGGTTLAARWGHRRSTDIDVTLPGDKNLSDLTHDDEHNLARRIGGKAARQDESEIKVICSDGALHVARLKPHAAGAEAVAITLARRRRASIQRSATSGATATSLVRGRQVPASGTPWEGPLLNSESGGNGERGTDGLARSPRYSSVRTMRSLPCTWEVTITGSTASRIPLSISRVSRGVSRFGTRASGS